MCDGVREGNYCCTKVLEGIQGFLGAQPEKKAVKNEKHRRIHKNRC